jgi:hypothetical protein
MFPFNGARTVDRRLKRLKRLFRDNVSLGLAGRPSEGKAPKAPEAPDPASTSFSLPSRVPSRAPDRLVSLCSRLLSSRGKISGIADQALQALQARGAEGADRG